MNVAPIDLKANLILTQVKQNHGAMSRSLQFLLPHYQSTQFSIVTISDND